MVAISTRSILIADDDPGIRESLHEILDREGWETHLAEDGREAIAILRVRVVRVALVDMRMPDLSGIETLRELHRLMSWLPVIAMTADRELWVREDVVAAGAFDLLWKPLRRAEVMGALDRALRTRPPADAGGGSA